MFKKPTFSETRITLLLLKKIFRKVPNNQFCWSGFSLTDLQGIGGGDKIAL